MPDEPTDDKRRLDESRGVRRGQMVRSSSRRTVTELGSSRFVSRANGGEIRVQYKTLEQLDDVCRRLSGNRTA